MVVFIADVETRAVNHKLRLREDPSLQLRKRPIRTKLKDETELPSCASPVVDKYVPETAKSLADMLRTSLEQTKWSHDSYMMPLR